MTTGQNSSLDDTGRSYDWTGIAAMLVGGFFIGLAPLGLRFAVDAGMEPVGVAFWRFFFSLPMFLLIFAVRKERLQKPTLPTILAGIFFGLDIICWHIALTMTSVANATFIVNLGNIILGFLAWLFFRQRPNVYWGGAVVLATIGAFCLSSGGISEDGSPHIGGDLWACLAACLVACYFLFASLARRTTNALNVIFWATFAATCVTFVVTIGLEGSIIPKNWGVLWIPFVIAILSQVFGQGLLIYGFGKTPPAIGGILVFAQPVTAALLSWPIFGETLALLQMLGAGLIMLAIMLTQRK